MWHCCHAELGALFCRSQAAPASPLGSHCAVASRRPTEKTLLGQAWLCTAICRAEMSWACPRFGPNATIVDRKYAASSLIRTGSPRQTMTPQSLGTYMAFDDTNVT